MAFTYDVSTDLGRVRLLITDTDATQPIFDDDEVQAFIDMEGGDIRLAGALALDQIASNQALVQKVIKLLDIQTDGAKLADSLRKHAASLRASAAGADSPAYAVITMVHDQFTLREHLWKDFLRGV